MANDNRLKLLSLRLAERLQRGEKLIKESMRTLQTDAARKPESTDRPRRPRSRKKERSRSVEKDVTRSSRLHRSPPKGYDFIAGLLDRNAADSLVMAKSDDFYADVAQFRKLNREECYGVSLSDLQKSDPALSDFVSDEDESSGSEVSDSEDYVLNDRLYPVRVPQWKNKRGPKAKPFQSRGKIRISIPRHLDPEKDFPTIA